MFRTALIITLLLFIITTPAAASHQSGEDNISGELSRGLVFIMIGLQFIPFGYAVSTWSINRADNDDVDISGKTLSNMLILGVILALIGTVLILGGIGHLI